MGRDTILAILDDDQGLCPDGHDCGLIWIDQYGFLWPEPAEGRDAARSCEHRDHRERSYIGWPLIKPDATPEQIAAVELIDPDLPEWARSSLADMESPIGD